VRTGLAALAVAVGAGKIVPSVADVDTLPFELLGAGFAVLGLAFTVYGARRFLRVERALDAGEFAPFDARAALALAGAGAVLGVATIALLFVH
jgi:uncharacterized membrane protein YidH (DUF202 family)